MMRYDKARQRMGMSAVWVESKVGVWSEEMGTGIIAAASRSESYWSDGEVG